MGLDVTYKGQQIAQLTEDGNLTLETAGKYCEGDIELAYSGGGGDFLKYATSIQYTFSYMTDGPDEFILDVPNVTSFTYGMSAYWQPKRFILKLSNAGLCTKMLGACRWLTSTYRLEYIKITGDLSNVTSYQNCFYSISNTNNVVIDADIDFSSATNVTGMFGHAWDITSIRFVQNTLKIDLNMESCRALDDASLISLANCLNESVTQKTLKCHETVQPRLAALLGTVSLDTATQTYHVFTADPNGSTTLADFITTTKGWTLTWSI